MTLTMVSEQIQKRMFGLLRKDEILISVLSQSKQAGSLSSYTRTSGLNLTGFVNLL